MFFYHWILESGIHIFLKHTSCHYPIFVIFKLFATRWKHDFFKNQNMIFFSYFSFRNQKLARKGLEWYQYYTTSSNNRSKCLATLHDYSPQSIPQKRFTLRFVANGGSGCPCKKYTEKITDIPLFSYTHHCGALSRRLFALSSSSTLKSTRGKRQRKTRKMSIFWRLEKWCRRAEKGKVFCEATLQEK